MHSITCVVSCFFCLNLISASGKLESENPVHSVHSAHLNTFEYRLRCWAASFSGVPPYLGNTTKVTQDIVIIYLLFKKSYTKYKYKR